MSTFFNFDAPEAAEVYDRERQAVGADIIAGLLHVHCGKQLKDLHVLDAGCGTGHYTKALIDLGVGKFTILDASSAMLKIATEKLKPHISNQTIDKVIEAKLPSLPFGNETFDAALFCLVLHHFDRNDYILTIQAAKKILKQNGIVLMITILPAIFKDGTWLGQIHPAVSEIIFNRFMTAKQHLSSFSEQGFQCIAAMNLLQGAMPSIYVNYFDHEGPLKEEWRRASDLFGLVDSEVEQEVEKKFLKLKHKGLLKQFMNDKDNSEELGYVSLFAFKLAEKSDIRS